MNYYDLFEELYRNKIQYLVVGGLALNLHGVPRLTYDIDLIISTEFENIKNLCSLISNLGFVPRLPVDPMDLASEEIRSRWINEKNLKAFSFYHKIDNHRVIDIIIDQPLIFQQAFNNKNVMKYRDIEIFVASINDLIEMKRNTGRLKDADDVENLLKAKTILEGHE